MYESNFLAHHIRKSSLGREDAVFAYLENGTALTYGKLFEGAEKYAAALGTHGVVAGDRVAVQVEKSIEVLKLYIGTVIAGGIFLPLNSAYTPSEVEYFLEDATPKVFVCDPDSVSSLQPVTDKCKISSIETMAADGLGSLFDLAAEMSSGIQAIARDKDDLAAILYTSGTTGRSKGAMLSHGNLWSNAATLKDYWHFSNEDILIHALPVFHTHGLFVATNVTLAAGSAVRFLSRFNADLIMDAIPKSSVFMGVPTFYVRLLEQAKLTTDYVKNMRLFVSGSAPLLSETHDSWREKTGHAILERYGMTETNMNTSNPYDGPRCAGTVGYPLPGVDVRITNPDKDDEEMAQGEIGSIEVRGPNVFSGYWQMPDKTKEELRENGFFITGDLGMIDDQGYVSIIGRSKDLIISGGYNIYPKELELQLDDIPGVIETAVVGLPHPDFGEAVAAVVVKESECSLSENMVKDAIKDKLAKFKQPKKVFFVEELPRNTMGKVQKKTLREIFSQTFQ